MKRIALTLFVFAMALQGVQAQPNLNFKRVVVNWPTIELYFSVGCNGNPAYNMAKQDFRIFENGKEVPDFTLWCPDPQVRCAISVALVFDASGSMSGAANTSAKAAGHSFIDQMDGVSDEATIIYFNTSVVVAQQMTTLKPLLYSAVDGLPAGGGTAVWDGTYRGLTELVNNGVNQCRAVIVMADGQDNASSHTPAEIISLANRERIRVFTIGLGPNVSASELEMIALLTGGRYYQTPTPAQMTAIYNEITTIIYQGFQECVITYDRSCADGGMRTVELQLTNFCGGTDVKTKSYRAPLDTTTFSNLHMRIDDVIGGSNATVKVPITLLTPMNNQLFYPFELEIEYDMQLLTYQGISFPAGSPLEVNPFMQSPTGTGVLFSWTGRKTYSGQGIMAELEFTTASVQDSADAFVRAVHAGFDQGCLLPQIEDGNVKIYNGPPITVHGPTTICEGDSVWLEAPTGFSSYLWSTGDTTRVITVFKEGNYSVTVKDATGHALPSSGVTITVYPLPTPMLNVSDTLRLCTGGSFTLGLQDTTRFTDYSWSNGGSLSSTVVTTPGNYYVTVTGLTGCQGTSDTLVVLSEDLDVRLNQPGTFEFCEGDTLVLDAGEYATYNWSNGESSRSIVVHESGSYFVSVVNAAGCTGVSDTAHVTVNPAPEPQITPAGSTVVCRGDSITLDAGAGYSSYKWNTGEETQTITVSNLGTFTVRVTNASGCEGVSRPVQVSVVDHPKPSIIVMGQAQICEGDSVTLDAGTGYETYLWSTGATTRRITVHQAGSYFVDVALAAGCEGRSDTVDVIVHPRPNKPVISRSDDELTSSESATGYQWFLDGNAIAGATSQSYTAVNTGSYRVVATNAFGCSTQSDPYDVNVLDVRRPSRQAAFHAYPDPNDGILQLVASADNPVQWDITVTNVLGQRYYTSHEARPLQSLRQTIDIQSAPPGLYILRVQAGAESWTKRIIRR
ncbi:VWA domain-containing protein [bacterium]|nr:VWA domain-containing protein [bacterium]